ncbi:bacteriocin biosynthesis protein [Actinomadura graeca]|uniref:Bacteriocin biosynthesis protein n=1 Tax=Actinomadura graeca TaxID=2750812 RepID=A0ABX8QSA0_9ACTN|nr:thiopeptide-type bacteriocin biosynthesis protein [Actinomadura graeca]QXJ21689.1 bacteriocin biosynthesis protein [Actinomadura graeca]
MDEIPCERSSWNQVNIAFPGKDARERERQAAAHLARILPAAEADGLITSWFFVRKDRWRVRYLPAEPGDRSVRSLLTQGVAWTSEIYEPEIHAFGGPASMDSTHDLFHADSRHVLTFLNGAPSDRRERSLILLTALMRASGLELGEQGDVWARIAEQRSALRGAPPAPDTWASFTDDVRRLLLGRPRPADIGNDWLTAFEKTGRQLRALRESGRLTRGIRAVTTLHVIFHWNRIGITGPAQAALAQAAKEATLPPH